MKIEIYSFFAGVGILDLGFSAAGFSIDFVNEINDDYLKAYQYARKVFPNIMVPNYGYHNDDIKQYHQDSFWNSIFPSGLDNDGSLIGFIGGPPCPDFSVAGCNEGRKGNNGILSEIYIDLIIKRQPDFFVFENVKGLYRTGKHRCFYDFLKRKLYRHGYSLFDSIENALMYGAPQDRERLFLVGVKRKRFGQRLTFSFGKHRVFDMKTINAVPWPGEDPFYENGYMPMPKNIIKQLTIEYWFRKNRVAIHPNANDIFNVKNKNKFFSIPEGHIKGKSFKRLHRWRYSPTAAYGNNEVHLHPYFPRRLSVAEVLAIQSVPSYFCLPAGLSLTKKFKMVANGVPFLLAKGIALDLRWWLQQQGCWDGGKNE